MIGYTETYECIYRKSIGCMEADIPYQSTHQTSRLIYSTHFRPWDTGFDHFLWREGSEVSLRPPGKKTRDVDTTGVGDRSKEVAYGSQGPLPSIGWGAFSLCLYIIFFQYILHLT